MSTALKCPNPVCPFLFDPTQVPPGAVLTCPRCAMRFMLGAPAAPAPEPPPVALAPPEPAPAPKMRVPRQSGGGGASAVAVLLGVVAVVGTVVAIGYVLVTQMQGGGSGGDRSEQVVREFNFKFTFPAPPWEKDPTPPSAVRANLFVLRRGESDVKMAFAAKDFSSRTPLPGDLREPLLDRLNHLFDDVDPTEEKNATWAGQPAMKYTFRGKQHGGDETFAGEAYAMAYKGVGYWSLAWAPEKEAAGHAEAFEQIRGKFQLLTERDDWKPDGTTAVVFVGDAAEYKLVDADRWWSKPGVSPREATEDNDPTADLVLVAEFKAKLKADVRPKAELIVHVLDAGAGKPLDVVRDHVRKRLTNPKRVELFGATKLTDVTGEPQGDPPSNAEQPVIETARLHAEPERDAATGKLLVLSALPVGGKIVGVVATCPWSDRYLWERRLMFTAGSVRPGR